MWLFWMRVDNMAREGSGVHTGFTTPPYKPVLRDVRVGAGRPDANGGGQRKGELASFIRVRSFANFGAKELRLHHRAR